MPSWELDLGLSTRDLKKNGRVWFTVFKRYFSGCHLYESYWKTWWHAVSTNVYASQFSIRELTFSAGFAVICFKFFRNHKFPSLLFPLTLYLKISDASRTNAQVVLNKKNLFELHFFNFNVLRQKVLILLTNRHKHRHIQTRTHTKEEKLNNITTNEQDYKETKTKNKNHCWLKRIKLIWSQSLKVIQATKTGETQIEKG